MTLHVVVSEPVFGGQAADAAAHALSQARLIRPIFAYQRMQARRPLLHELSQAEGAQQVTKHEAAA